MKLPMWAKTGGKKKLPAHEELWTWVWLCKPRRASTTISSVLIWRQKCEYMVEMLTNPGPAGAPSVRQIKLPACLLLWFSIRWIKMYGERSRRFRVWLPSSSCWSDRVKDASDSPQTSGSPSQEQPATHAVVTHHSWQRQRVRARHCGGNIITKTILGWRLPPPLWRKMGENKHSQPEKQ